jgi:hypothetical protein
MRSRKRLRPAISDKKVSSFDRYIYSVVARNYLLSDLNIARAYPKLAPGMIKGAFKRLKDAGWIVYVPSLCGHMTTRNYKDRIDDGSTMVEDDDANWHR